MNVYIYIYIHIYHKEAIAGSGMCAVTLLGIFVPAASHFEKGWWRYTDPDPHPQRLREHYF